MITRFSALVTGVSLPGYLSFLEPVNARRLASEMGFNSAKVNAVKRNIESQNLASNYKIKGENKGQMKKRTAGRPYTYYKAKGLFETG